MEKYSINGIKLFIKQIIARELKESIDHIDESANFYEFGLDSINSTYLLDQVETEYSISLTPLYFWDYPSIALFAEQIHKELSL